MRSKDADFAGRNRYCTKGGPCPTAYLCSRALLRHNHKGNVQKSTRIATSTSSCELLLNDEKSANAKLDATESASKVAKTLLLQTIIRQTPDMLSTPL